MIELNRINFRLDVEVAHLLSGNRKEDRCLLIWRILQALNKKYAGGCGIFSLSWVMEELAELLDVSEETIRRMTVLGDGKWWRLTNGRLILTGHTKMAAMYGTEERGESVRMRVRFVDGSISNFRKVLYALYIKAAGEQFVGRDVLAHRVGVSTATLRRWEQDGWVQVTPSVEVVDGIPAQPVMFAQFPVGERVRTWPDERGGMLLVRQMENAYRTRFGGRRCNCGAGHDGLQPVQYAMRPVGAVVRQEAVLGIGGGATCIGSF